MEAMAGLPLKFAVRRIFVYVLLFGSVFYMWRASTLQEYNLRDTDFVGSMSSSVYNISQNTEVVKHIQWNPSMDVLKVREAFRHPIQFTTLLTRHSIVKLEDPDKVYRVGEDIRVNIILKFNPAEGHTLGGDNVRIHMAETEKGASVSGYVIDHRNGSYTGVLKALWEGRCTIYVAVKHTRTQIAYLYEMRQQMPTVRHLNAKFINGQNVAFSKCHMLAKTLDDSNGVCGLTKLNAGVPWYCQVPKQKNMTCNDLQFIVREEYNEIDILARVKRDPKVWRVKSYELSKELGITVKGSIDSKRDAAKPPCNKYNYSDLWEQPSPTGHFYKHRWYPYHCTARSVSHKHCIKNKHFIFYGDSTIRQWYEDMHLRFNCTESSYSRPGTRERLCETTSMNLTMYQSRHNYPGNSMDPNDTSSLPNLASDKLEDLADRVENDRLPVIIVHIYFHYTYYQQNFYRLRIKLLRFSLEKILQKRSDAKILIKGPHLIKKRTVGTCDYYAYVYRLILIEELAPLRDRVIYLDEMDISNAGQVWDVHPNLGIVREMVDQMLAYVCD